MRQQVQFSENEKILWDQIWRIWWFSGDYYGDGFGGYFHGILHYQMVMDETTNNSALTG